MYKYCASLNKNPLQDVIKKKKILRKPLNIFIASVEKGTLLFFFLSVGVCSCQTRRLRAPCGLYIREIRPRASNSLSPEEESYNYLLRMSTVHQSKQCSSLSRSLFFVIKQSAKTPSSFLGLHEGMQRLET